METISQLLFWISNGLMVPVVLLLLALFLCALVMAGSFFGEFIRRRGERKRLETLLEAGKASPGSPWPPAESLKGGGALSKAFREMAEHRHDEARCRHLLANYEVEADRELGRSRLLGKLGPMLGLMGTLIPMGPALVSLAAGDLGSMARNMQVAFATTVVGMLSAAVGVVTLQVRRRWFSRELNDLEYFYRIIRKEAGNDQA